MMIPAYRLLPSKKPPQARRLVIFSIGSIFKYPTGKTKSLAAINHDEAQPCGLPGSCALKASRSIPCA